MSQQFSLHPLDQYYCYNQLAVESASNATNSVPPISRQALHRRAAHYYRSQRRPRSEWRRLADLEPNLNEFEHRIQANEGDEAARILLDIDRDHLWEWGYIELLGTLYARLSALSIHDARLAHQVARRKAWQIFFVNPLEADRQFAHLLAEARRQGFLQEEADALDDLAQTFRRYSRDLDQAISYHQQSLTIYRQIGDRRGEADALGGLGAIYTQIDPEEAIDYLLMAESLQRQLGNHSSLVFVQTMLGLSYVQLSAFAEAQHILDQAAQLAKEMAGPLALSRAYGALAYLQIATGQDHQVQVLLESAMAHNREWLGLSLSGALLFSFVQCAIQMASQGALKNAIALMERISDTARSELPQMVRQAVIALSLVLTLAGDFKRARALLPQDPMLVPVAGFFLTYWIGVLLIKTGERDAANAYLQRGLEGHDLADAMRPLGRGAEDVTVVAYAGLALLAKDRRLVEVAIQRSKGLPRLLSYFKYNLTMPMLNLLMEEPDSQILIPLRDAIDHRSG